MHLVNHPFDFLHPVATIAANGIHPPLGQGGHGRLWGHAHHGTAACVKGQRGANRLVRNGADASHGRLHLPQIAHRLNPEQIRAPLGQPLGLLGKGGHGRVIAHLPHRFQQFARRADGTRHDDQMGGGVGRRTADFGRRLVQCHRLLLQMV